jgi:hypothetical protein
MSNVKELFEVIQEFKQMWRAIFRNEPPKDAQWMIWGKMHDMDTVREGLLQLALRHRKLAGVMDMDHMIRFSSAVMNRLTRDKLAALERLKVPTASVMMADDDSIGNRA